MVGRGCAPSLSTYDHKPISHPSQEKTWTRHRWHLLAVCGNITSNKIKGAPMLRPSGILATIIVFSAFALAQATGPGAWQNDLTPIAPSDWNRDFAAHLLERAGFGGTPEEIDALAKLTPAQAIARMVRFQGVAAGNLPPFEHSGIHDPGLEPFPPS